MECKIGINHIEYWVSNRVLSEKFYDSLYEIIGWRKLGPMAYSTGAVEIYYVEKTDMKKHDCIGPRHLCFQATSREMVDEVGMWLKSIDANVIRGPIEMNHYSDGYYTVDFRDPDGFVLEVAYTPNMSM